VKGEDRRAFTFTGSCPAPSLPGRSQWLRPALRQNYNDEKSIA
jgi:hypothetical protein